LAIPSYHGFVDGHEGLDTVNGRGSDANQDLTRSWLSDGQVTLPWAAREALSRERFRVDVSYMFGAIVSRLSV
jgi:hypothetical protein